MRTPKFTILVTIAVCLMARGSLAQTAEQPAYLNPLLPAEQRAKDLVQRMTVEEKVTQLTNQSRAIPRLNVPAYNWWSEALHGVRGEFLLMPRLECETVHDNGHANDTISRSRRR